jgi:hypothetical protein
MTDLDEDTRLKLIGLRAVGQDLWQQIQAVEKAAARLVGEPDEMTGHASDFIAAADGSRSTPERLWANTAEYREKKGDV